MKLSPVFLFWLFTAVTYAYSMYFRYTSGKLSSVSSSEAANTICYVAIVYLVPMVVIAYHRLQLADAKSHEHYRIFRPFFESCDRCRGREVGPLGVERSEKKQDNGGSDDGVRQDALEASDI